MIRCLFGLGLMAVACGTPSNPAMDASTVGDGVSSDGPSADGGFDASEVDAPIGVLTPDPADPASLPCSGLLGFPGVPALSSYGNIQRFVVTDVDVDGKQDVVFATFESINVAHGNGDGTFAALTVFSVPVNAYLFRVVDVNADGKPDLVYGGPQQQFVSVSLNNGSGAFGTPQTYSTVSPNTSTIDSIEVGDLNGDTRPDIVAMHSGSGIAIVLLNTGTSFSAAQFYDAGTQYTHELAIGDVTGDGRADIVAANTSASTVSVLANLGNGAFAGRVTYEVLSPYSIVLGDMDEDGMLDVVVGNMSLTSETTVSILRNLGAGILGAPSSYVAAQVPLTEPRILASADVNGDGHLDVGASQTLGEGASILLGTGTGQLGPPIIIATDQQSGSMAFSDLNADARKDLVLLNGESITPYLNNGTPSLFDRRDRHQFGVTYSNRGVRMADLDGNGRPDLIGMGTPESSSSSLVVTRLASGGGAFTSPSTMYTPGLFPQRSAVADIDNDNRQDLLVLGYAGTGYAGRTFFNAGNGTLSPAISFSMVDQATLVRIGDLNGDGWRDLIVPSYNPTNYDSVVHYYGGLGNGQFATGTVIWSGKYVEGVAIADLDMDGKLDVVVDNYTTVARRDLLRGVGNGTFHPPNQTLVSAMNTHLASRDLNEDGKPDIIGFFSYDNVISVALGIGDGTLAPPLYSPAPGVSVEPAFADFNGDGHLDVATISGPRALILLGRGDGRFDPPRFYDVGRGDFFWPSTITAGDIDGDGRVDLLVNNYQDRVSVLRGRCLN